MKRLLFVSFILMFVLFSCKKENTSIDTGMITGPDMRECVCCGGWFIEIDDSTWRFMDAPQDSNIDLANVTFPIKVELDWQIDANACLPDEILVTYLREKN